MQRRRVSIRSSRSHRRQVETTWDYTGTNSKFVCRHCPSPGCHTFPNRCHTFPNLWHATHAIHANAACCVCVSLSLTAHTRSGKGESPYIHSSLSLFVSCTLDPALRYSIDPSCMYVVMYVSIHVCSHKLLYV